MGWSAVIWFALAAAAIVGSFLIGELAGRIVSQLPL